MKDKSLLRLSVLRSTTFPYSLAPAMLKEFLAKTILIVVISIWTPLIVKWFGNIHFCTLRCRQVGLVHYIR